MVVIDSLFRLVGYYYWARPDNQLLVDVYHDDPVHLDYIITQLENIQKPESGHGPGTEFCKEQVELLIRDLSDELSLVFELPRFQRFASSLLPPKPGSEKSVRRLLLETSDRVRRRMTEVDAFGAFMRRDSDDLFTWGATSPFIVGLQHFFLKELRNFKSALVHYIKEKWQSPSLDSLVAISNSESPSSKLFDGTQLLHIAFAPSGSGKTTAILRELTCRYGCYMVASALAEKKDNRSSNVGPNILDPKIQRGASKDTFALFRMLKFVSNHLKKEFASRTWNIILHARLMTFRLFQDALSAKHPMFTPALWLAIQLDCVQWDPFLQYFRLLSLVRGHYSDPVIEEQQVLAQHRLMLSCICIDEAQEDFRYLFDEGYDMLHIAVAEIVDTLGTSMAIYGQTTAKALVAGTSLNLKKALDSLQPLRRTHTFRGYQWGEREYKIVRNFPFVRDNDGAKMILHACGIKCQKVLDEAANNSRSLWGRVKWTSMYAEKIAEKLKDLELSGADPTSDASIKALDLRRLADETFEDVVGQLVHRLGIIQRRGDGAELLRKLLEAAISADIRGLPHVFHHESEMELVDQGFATVATAIDRLSEELSGHFTITDKTPNQLSLRLHENLNVERGMIHLLATAAKRGFSIAECTLNACTPEIAANGIIIVDCLPFQLTTDSARTGYATKGRPARQSKLKAKLGTGFTVDTHGTDYMLFAVLKPGATMALSLPEDLKAGHYCTAATTIDNLQFLVRKGFTINDSSLVAELKERVVIEAILRFSESELAEQLIYSIKGVTSRTGLGHPAEHLLAMVCICVLIHTCFFFCRKG